MVYIKIFVVILRRQGGLINRKVKQNAKTELFEVCAHQANQILCELHGRHCALFVGINVPLGS